MYVARYELENVVLSCYRGCLRAFNKITRCHFAGVYEIAVGVEAETGGGKGGAQDLIVGHLFVIGIGIETGEQNGTPGETWCASIGIVIMLGGGARRMFPSSAATHWNYKLAMLKVHYSLV